MRVTKAYSAGYQYMNHNLIFDDQDLSWQNEWFEFVDATAQQKQIVSLTEETIYV